MTFKDEGWGSEYVGLAIHRVTDELNWSKGDRALRVIYVVGNETARQGPDEFDYAKTSPAAIGRGIVVNAIYCGDVDYQQATPTWRELARLADGQYMEIAGDGGAIVMATPFDEELAALNARLNTTYLAYGPAGGAGAANQLAQDQNATRLGTAVAAERAIAKTATLYCQSRWDLVDAMQQPGFDLGSIDEKDLPEELRKLSAAERLTCVEGKLAERQAVQKEIQAIAQRRSEFIAGEIQRLGLSADNAFDEAVKQSIVEQAERAGFEFEEK